MCTTRVLYIVYSPSVYAYIRHSLSCMQQGLRVMKKNVCSQEKSTPIEKKSPSLSLSHVSLCARYVPTDWSSKVELTLEEVNKLNKLNMELASELSAKNPVYTPFQHGNFTCIMIKEVYTLHVHAVVSFV